MKLMTAYRSLTEEQQRIVREKQVDLNGTIDELIATLQSVAAFDKVGGGTRSQLGCAIGLLIAALVGSLLFAGKAGPIVFIIVVLAVIAGLIYTIRLYTWSSSVDVSDNLGGFAMPMLLLMRDDFDGNEPVHLHLDLRAPTSKEKCTGTGEPRKSGGYYKIVDTMYRDDWFSGQARLNDGSRLRWWLTEIIRASKKSKKTARGKYKTKTKYKKKAKLEVEVTLKKKTYDVTAPAEDKVKESETGTTVRASREFVASSLDPIPLDPMMDLITGIYSAASPAK